MASKKGAGAEGEENQRPHVEVAAHFLLLAQHGEAGFIVVLRLLDIEVHFAKVVVVVLEYSDLRCRGVIKRANSRASLTTGNAGKGGEFSADPESTGGPAVNVLYPVSQQMLFSGDIKNPS